MSASRRASLSYFALKATNLGVATAWSFALIFVLIRRMPLADYASVVVVTALGAYLMACDLGMSNAVYARARTQWLQSGRLEGHALRFGTAVLGAYCVLTVFAIGAFTALAHALPIGAGMLPNALSVYFAALSLALPWSVVRALLAATDRFLAFEIVEFGRRIMSLALVLGLYFDLSFAAYSWCLLAAWAAALVILSSRLSSVTSWRTLRSFGAWKEAFSGQWGLVRQSGNFSLLEFLVFNFPYLLLPTLFGAGHAIVAFDVFNKITRFGAQSNIVTFEALLPMSTQALHAGEHARWRRITTTALAISLVSACLGSVFVLPLGDATFGLLLGDATLVPFWLRICMVAMLLADAFRAGGALLMLNLGRVSRLLPLSFGGAAAFATLTVVAGVGGVGFTGFMAAYVVIFAVTSLLYFHRMFASVRQAAPGEPCTS